MPDNTRISPKHWLWITLLVIVLDQLSKLIADHYLQFHRPVEIMPMFNFTLMYNKGAAFSFLANQGGWQRWFFAILALVVSGFIIFWIRKLKNEQTWTAIALALVLGGAVGNLIDRVMYGRVIDFIDLYVNFKLPMLNLWQDGFWHFATFNVADIAITLGATLLVFISLFQKDDEAEKVKPKVL
jgi:signal peptidase II